MAPEPVLPWRDMLHDGPVRAGLDVAALAAERAAFLAARFRLDPDEPRLQFAQRDASLAAALARGDELVLWFEHDLYDQLQLAQILDRLPPAAPARLAQADTYLHVLEPTALAALGDAAPPVTPAQRELAGTFWAAFTSVTPEALAAMAARDLAPLRWLRPAVLRLLEELPEPTTGLSRTERHTLESLSGGGGLRPGELFRRAQAADEPWFMGDWPFFLVLDELAAEPMPLIAGLPVGGFAPGHQAYLDAALRLTEAGAAALAGRLDRATAKPVRRWLGGTRLDPAALWRWHAATATLERDAAPPV